MKHLKKCLELLQQFQAWLISIAFAVCGSADLLTGAFTEMAVKAGWPPHYAETFKAFCFIITVFVIARQKKAKAPLLKRAKNKIE